LDLSIIIVNWNSVEYLKNCIASILAETQGIFYEIIVIDAGSFDGCGQMLRQFYPQVRFIQSKENLGFARANNAALKTAAGDCILFLNPDTELVGPVIQTLFDALKKLPNSGVLGCRLLNSDKTVQTSCIQSFPTLINQFLDSEFLRSLFPKSRLWGVAPLTRQELIHFPVDVISGACMFARRSVLESVGAFSEDYFMYSEDVDLSYKLTRAGFENFYIPGARIIHHGGGSSSQNRVSHFSSVMLRESRWRYFKKTNGLLYALLYRLSMILLALCRLCILSALGILRFFRITPKSVAKSFGKWLEILKWGLGFEARCRS